jgi:hypothetical protein
VLEELDFEDKGESYRGTQSKTIGGLVCQSWDSEFPHEHGHTYNKYPDSDLISNFCRNPLGEKESIWCFTTDETIRW